MPNEKKEVFEGKSFSDLLKDIYNNSDKKKKQIDILVRELTPLIKTVNEAAVIVPLIKEYLEVGVKNDEQLVKMAAIFQKYIAADARTDAFGKSLGGGTILTVQEKEQLLQEVANELIKEEDLSEKEKIINNDFDSLLKKTENIVKDINVNGDEK